MSLEERLTSFYREFIDTRYHETIKGKKVSTDSSYYRFKEIADSFPETLGKKSSEFRRPILTQLLYEELENTNTDVIDAIFEKIDVPFIQGVLGFVNDRGGINHITEKDFLDFHADYKIGSAPRKNNYLFTINLIRILTKNPDTIDKLTEECYRNPEIMFKDKKIKGKMNISQNKVKALLNFYSDDLLTNIRNIDVFIKKTSAHYSPHIRKNGDYTIPPIFRLDFIKGRSPEKITALYGEIQDKLSQLLYKVLNEITYEKIKDKTKIAKFDLNLEMYQKLMDFVHNQAKNSAFRNFKEGNGIENIPFLNILGYKVKIVLEDKKQYLQFECGTGYNHTKQLLPKDGPIEEINPLLPAIVYVLNNVYKIASNSR